jgi:hypothetical protein
MDSLFGEGTSLPVRFFIAFVVVFALIGVTAWLIRRFGTGRSAGPARAGVRRGWRSSKPEPSMADESLF